MRTSPLARALVFLVVLLAAGVVAFVWVRPSLVAPVTESAPAAPPSVEEAAKLLREQEKLRDEVGRGLLASFDARVYRPARDASLEQASGTIDVRADGRDARFRFTFDASRSEREQVEVTPVDVPADLPDDVAKQVKAWAILSLRGAYAGVAYFVPPDPLESMPSKKEKHKVVWARPYRDEPENVSYNFDERDLVVSRGQWITGGAGGPKWSLVTNYEWELWHGRYLLRRATVVDGPSFDYEHEDRDGVLLLRKARSRQGERVMEAVITYEALRKR